MAGTNLNRSVISGNLTRDPSLKDLPSGTKVCDLRVAVNGRIKKGDEWVDKPNFFNVTVFGKQGENVAQYLKKGSGIAVDGRLDWREWDKDDQHFEAVQIIADNVQFLGDGKSSNGSSSASAPASDVPAESEPAAAATAPDDDDIPF